MTCHAFFDLRQFLHSIASFPFVSIPRAATKVSHNLFSRCHDCSLSTLVLQSQTVMQVVTACVTAWLRKPHLHVVTVPTHCARSLVPRPPICAIEILAIAQCLARPAPPQRSASPGPPQRSPSPGPPQRFKFRFSF